MSSITYSHHTQLSDDVEREIMRKAVSEGQSISLVALFKTSFAVVGKALRHAFDFLVDVTNALNEARAKDARYSRSYW